MVTTEEVEVTKKKCIADNYLPGETLLMTEGKAKY